MRAATAHIIATERILVQKVYTRVQLDLEKHWLRKGQLGSSLKWSASSKVIPLASTSKTAHLHLPGRGSHGCDIRLARAHKKQWHIMTYSQ